MSRSYIFFIYHHHHYHQRPVGNKTGNEARNVYNLNMLRLTDKRPADIITSSPDRDEA